MFGADDDPVLVLVAAFREVRIAGARDFEVVVAVTTRPPVLNRDLPCRLVCGTEMDG